MRAVVSAKIKVPASEAVLRTVKAYKRGLRHCVDEAWERRIRNNIRLHPLVYQHLRKTLPAQLAVACIRQACGMVKKARTKPAVKRAGVGYNFPRSAKLSGETLHLRLLDGRESFTLSIPDCYRAYFEWELREGALLVDKRGRAFFRFTFAKEVEARTHDSSQAVVLGIDLGVKRLAVLSGGEHIHGKSIRGVKRRYDYLRKKLQAKGTRSAKRLLQRRRRKEQRFVAWANHNVSKHIVDYCDAAVIRLENLKGVKKRTGRRQNRMLGRWSYFQLQRFIEYKAAMHGVTVEYVRPAYTSQLCHRCGVLGERHKGGFACQHCGITSFSADLNAARNIAHPRLGERQAAITRPHDQGVEAKAGGFPSGIAVESMVKYPLLQ